MKNLPWTAIADDLGNQRTPLDYLRHWPNLRRSLLITWGEGGIRKQDVSIAVKVAVEKKAKVQTDEIELHQTILLILRCLNDRVDADDDIVDESDIRWADIDRLCGLSYGEAGISSSVILFLLLFTIYHYII